MRIRILAMTVGTTRPDDGPRVEAYFDCHIGVVKLANCRLESTSRGLRVALPDRVFLPSRIIKEIKDAARERRQAIIRKD